MGLTFTVRMAWLGPIMVSGPLAIVGNCDWILDLAEFGTDFQFPLALVIGWDFPACRVACHFDRLDFVGPSFVSKLAEIDASFQTGRKTGPRTVNFMDNTNKSKKPYYGKKTKRKVVEEYLKTSASMDELSRLHGILGSNTVSDWIRKYGNLSSISNNLNESIMKKPHASQEDKQQRAQRQKTNEQLSICDLESDLMTTRERVQFYQYALDFINALAKELTGIDLLKKTGDELSNRSAKQVL